MSRSTSLVETVSGACEGRGAGDGAVDLQIGVVGVESASVSMSVRASGASLLGGGVVVTFTGCVYLYGLIYWLISGLLYESASGLAWGPHYAYYFTVYLLISTS